MIAGRVIRQRAGRGLAYVVLAALGLFGIAPFVYMLILSFKRRIDILVQVPPTLSFQWKTIASSYREVLHSQGMLEFVGNSILVVGTTVMLRYVQLRPGNAR